MSDLPDAEDLGEEIPDVDELDEIEVEEPEEGEEPPDQELDENGDPVEPEPQRRPAARGRRDQAARLRERLDRTERELQELRTNQQNYRPQAAPVDPQAYARAEQEKWERRAMMSPAEAMREVQQESEQRIQQYMMGVQLNTQDTIDKQAYAAEAKTSRVHRQYQAQVEALLANERARGNFAANRNSLLAYLVGQDTIRRSSAAAPKQRRQAAGRVAGQQTRPTSPRGDGGQARRPAADSYEAAVERVRGKPLW